MTSEIINFGNYLPGKTITFDYPCLNDKTNCYPYQCIFVPGKYLLEVYGAEGGRARNINGGLGGFSMGLFQPKNKVKGFIHVGAQGISTGTTPSAYTLNAYNGGGIGTNSATTGRSYEASSGGGASDIRLEVDDVFHRLIVAGGGGGSGFYSQVQKGGNGGGIEGEDGQMIVHQLGDIFSDGGNQEGSINMFGYGGNQSSGWDGCGGGGGWYGGTPGGGYTNAGAGGSGFVYTKDNYEIAIKSQLKLSQKYFLTNGMTTELGTDGKQNDGIVYITVLSFQLTCIQKIFSTKLFCISFFLIFSF